MNDLSKHIFAPYNYIVQFKGKRIRTQMIQAFNHWLKIPDDKMKIISIVIEMLHNSSLLIDDIEDNAVLRRGLPVAHKIFGISSTISAANYVFFLSLNQIISTFPPQVCSQAITIFANQLVAVHRGQGLDIFWRDSFICPSEEDYKEMIQLKTGGLFELAVQLMQLFSKDKRDYSKLITLLGTYFQIRDDYSSLKSKKYQKNKSYCEDLTEGKYSFPIIHAIRCHPNDKTLLNIMKQRTHDVNLKKFAIAKLESLGSFEYTKKIMKELSAKTNDEVKQLGGNLYFTKLLKLLKNI